MSIIRIIDNKHIEERHNRAEYVLISSAELTTGEMRSRFLRDADNLYMRIACGMERVSAGIDRYGNGHYISRVNYTDAHAREGEALVPRIQEIISSASCSPFDLFEAKQATRNKIGINVDTKRRFVEISADGLYGKEEFRMAVCLVDKAVDALETHSEDAGLILHLLRR